MIQLLAEGLSIETILISGISSLAAAVAYLFSYVMKSMASLREDHRACTEDREQLWIKVAELSGKHSCSSCDN